MPSKTEEELLEEFENVSWRSSTREAVPAGLPAGEGLTESTTFAAAATPAGQNVPGGSKTEVQNSDGVDTVATVIRDVFESGMGAIPLIGGLMGLFGGGHDSPPSFSKYQMPSSISFLSAEREQGLGPADFGQDGAPRAYEAAHTGTTQPLAGSGPQAGGGPQITVNVQAMDAQSFLDRSGDIAQAVRSAMLSMSSINDIVNEL
jgi:hypothetical protein